MRQYIRDNEVSEREIRVSATMPGHARWKEFKRLGKGLLFISPWLIGFLAFGLYPFLGSAYYSLTSYSVLSASRFVGLRNYQELFFEDKLFWISLYNTLYFTLFSVTLGTVWAIGLASLLNLKNVKGIAVYRTTYYLPSIVPLVAASVVWLWLFNPQYGIINTFLHYMGVPTIGWFTDPLWAKPAFVIMSLWGIGGAILIYLAGLQDVPQELYEAAALDGASGLQRFWHVTIPMVSPVILFNVIISLIGSFQYFTQAYVITSGGPADSTLFYSLYLYNNAFSYYRMGYASALAWILFLMVQVTTLLVLRTSARRVYYGGA